MHCIDFTKTRRIYHFLICLSCIPLCISLDIPMSSICNDTSAFLSTMGKDAIFSVIFQWCVMDETCRDKYHQTTPNATVFYHIAKPLGNRYNYLEQPLVEFLCNDDETEQLRILWLSLLNAYTEKPLCDINHSPVFQSEGLTWSCECEFGTQCEFTGSPSSVIILIMMIAVLVTMTIALVCLLIDTIFSIKKWREIRDSDKALNMFLISNSSWK
jgi:hypothetical protein